MILERYSLITLGVMMTLGTSYGMEGMANREQQLMNCDQGIKETILTHVRSSFPRNHLPVEIISCDGGSTPFASFSHASAEISAGYVEGIQDMQSLGDPAWVPFNLMPPAYQSAFDEADWQQVLYAETIDPVTEARVFLIRGPQERSFAIITSE